jgi:hypothetical protein
MFSFNDRSTGGEACDTWRRRVTVGASRVGMRRAYEGPDADADRPESQPT